MKTVAPVVLGLAVVAPLGLSAQAPPSRPWLHVRVEEPDTKVRVNLPLNVVEAALRAAPQTLVSKGRLRLGQNRLKVSELRAMWRELKAAADAELVGVEGKDEQVRVERKGDLVQVRVTRKSREQVHVEVPVTVVEALLAGEGDALDVYAALAELKKRRGDVVRVSEDKSTVRVWIDESHNGGGQ